VAKKPCRVAAFLGCCFARRAFEELGCWGTAMENRAGVGLLPSQIDSDEEYGHMWVYWSDDESDRLPYRGYYPDVTALPEGISLDDVPAAIEYIKHNSVRGVLVVDDKAYTFQTESRKADCYKGTWQITPKEQFLLKSKCAIPIGEDKIIIGDYSWDESRPDWNNCSSWVINAVNEAVEDEAFLSCKRPKKLKVVIEDLWGDVKPSKEKEFR